MVFEKERQQPAAFEKGREKGTLRTTGAAKGVTSFIISRPRQGKAIWVHSSREFHERRIKVHK